MYEVVLENHVSITPVPLVDLLVMITKSSVLYLEEVNERVS